MIYTTPAIREARRQCREERMRQGLDRHLINEAEVYERANLISQLEMADALIELSGAAREMMSARLAAGYVLPHEAPAARNLAEGRPSLLQRLRLRVRRMLYANGAQVD